MLKHNVVLILSVVVCVFVGLGSISAKEKPKYMWFDAEANYKRLSNPDSVIYYLKAIKEAGCTDAVVDVKTIMGEVLYDSKIAPFMESLDGTSRSRNYDMLRVFIEEGHKLGLRVHGIYV